MNFCGIKLKYVAIFFERIAVGDLRTFCGNYIGSRFPAYR